MQWIASHSTALIFLANAGVILVWVFFGYLMVADFAKLRRPKLLISRQQRLDIDSICNVINMGQEAVYLSAVLAVVNGQGRTYRMDLTNYMPSLRQSGSTVGTLQGPLASGSEARLDTFRHLVQYVLKESEASMRSEEMESIEIRIIATHGRDNKPFGVYRRFDQQGSSLKPASFHTCSLSPRWHQGTLRRWQQQVARA